MDGWTSGSKLPAAAWKLGKYQEAQDSFVLHRMSYCDTTPVQKPFPQQLEGMLQQGCWWGFRSTVLASSSKQRETFSDAVGKRGPRRAGVSSVTSICYGRHWFGMKGGQGGYLDQTRQGGHWLGHLAHWEQKQPPARSQLLGRAWVGILFFIASMDGTRLATEIARFTQVHQPYAVDISAVQKQRTAPSSVHHLYCSQRFRCCSHSCTCAVSCTVSGSTQKALPWGRTPSISSCQLQTVVLSYTAMLPPSPAPVVRSTFGPELLCC